MANPNIKPRWVKGQSGNPGGRPKTKVVTEALAKELRVKGPGGKHTHLELAAWKMVQLAIAGDVAAFKEIANRLEGTPVQATEVSGPDGQPLVFTLTLDRPPALESDDANA